MAEPFQIAAHVKVMHRLEHKGFQAFLVGGCVRDRILSRGAKDFDITTDATPEQVRAIFTHTIPVGAKFGVVVVVMDGVQVEVATFRADGAYSDGRRPDEVTYSKSAEEDVIRRDFTMNGLLLNSEGKVIDYVGGLTDINKRVIRAIGDANVRFTEDALRMMRACRFAAQIGFEIEKETFEAMRANARLIKNISHERIAMELFKMLASPEPLKGLLPFIQTGLYRFALPLAFENYFNLTYSVQRFDLFNANKDTMLGMAMLFADIGSFVHEELANYLKLSGEQKDELIYCAHHVQRFSQHMGGSFMPEAAIKRALREPGVALALEILVQNEVMGRTSYGLEALMAFVLKVKAYTPEQYEPTPLVTGKDLIAAGIPPSNLYSMLLFDLESFQLNGVFTTKEQAMAYVNARVYKAEDGWVYSGLTPREVQELEG